MTMNQSRTPQLNSFDIAVFGRPDGKVTSYRRVYNVETEVVALAPRDAKHPGEYFAAYLWDSEKNQWVWLADSVHEDKAREAAINVAGTDQLYTA